MGWSVGRAMQVYMWGASSQVSAGDKYEGQFRNGLPHGSGRTMYADGGWHKVMNCSPTSSYLIEWCITTSFFHIHERQLTPHLLISTPFMLSLEA